jgi:hypothetical protein
MPKTKTPALPAEPTKPEAKPVSLTETQLKIANLAADLIMRGGHEDDIRSLIFAVLRHQRRMAFGVREAINSGEDWMQRDAAALTLSLSKHWPEGKPESDAPMPDTVSQEARERLRERLDDHLDAFKAKAKMHELHLLVDAFEMFDTHSDLDIAEDECPLLESIMWGLVRNDQYVHVRKEHVDLVKNFVEVPESKATKAA